MKKRNFFSLFEVTTFIEFQIKHSHLHTPHSFSSFSLAMNNELISHHILSIQTKHRKFSMYTLHSYLVALHFLHLYCELQTLYSSDEKKAKNLNGIDYVAHRTSFEYIGKPMRLHIKNEILEKEVNKKKKHTQSNTF